MKFAAVTLAALAAASIILPTIAEASCNGRASSAECSYQRQSESAKRAYGNGR